MANTELLFDQLDESALLRIAAKLASLASAGLVIYLQGTLGAGKTTFSRGFIQALGHQGAVKSPTYTLVEPYTHLTPPVFHFDLYRLAEPEELEYIGIRDYVEQQALMLIEWPQQGVGFLPAADICLSLRVNQNASRQLTLQANSAAGQNILDQIA